MISGCFKLCYMMKYSTLHLLSDKMILKDYMLSYNMILSDNIAYMCCQDNIMSGNMFPDKMLSYNMISHSFMLSDNIMLSADVDYLQNVNRSHLSDMTF
jgi:hypothetical protein